MKRFRLRKTLCPEDVRIICIQNDLYTRGTNEEYNFMLEMCEEKVMVTINIYKIAEDILEHSYTDLTLDDIALMLMQKVQLVINDRENS